MNPPPSPPRSLRLLYVEDNRLSALLFEEAVRMQDGVELRLARDGSEALCQVREWRPDVMVLDGHLPDMSGYQLLDLLRREPGLDRIPVFMCSADALPEDVEHAAQAGFAGYWPKPIEIARIMNDLQRVRASLASSPAAYDGAHRHPPLQSRLARRADRAGGTPLPGRVPRRPARGRDPEAPLVADPAWHRPARSAGAVRGPLREHLDARRVAAQGLDGQQAKLLLGYLGQRGHRIAVKVAMRYGRPAIGAVLDELRASGVERVLVLPLYPQYCAATTATVVDEVSRWARGQRALPELRFVNRYHDDRGYIEALVKRVNDHWMAHGEPERLVLSFHGVPKRTQQLGDPYHDQCQETARLLRERLRLKPAQVLVTFQSRFGKAEWLQPYTEPTLVALAREGVKRVDVMCPGFQRRLPRDPRGDRPGSARRIPRRGWRGVPLHRVPQRPARMDRRPRRPRDPPPAGMADAARGRCSAGASARPRRRHGCSPLTASRAFRGLRSIPMDEVRLDKWLWAARFYKTRSVAVDEIGKGRVSVNGQPAKPARAVRVSDQIEVRREGVVRTVLVRALSEVRGPAPVAQALYEETPESIARREQQARSGPTPQTPPRPSSRAVPPSGIAASWRTGTAGAPPRTAPSDPKGNDACPCRLKPAQVAPT
jgi:ribosomal 50S subunit-recycling heat shock protein/CheY-like chemotaxis protein